MDNTQPVVIAVIENNHRQVLIAERQAHQSCPGMWEFPGGKVEAGENLDEALSREISEEINIRINMPIFLFKLPYHYPPDVYVELHIFHITHFTGEPHGAEGQAIRWVTIDDLSQYEFPAANQAIINWLQQS